MVWCRSEEGRSNTETSLHALQKQLAEQAQELQKLQDSQLQAFQTHADAASIKELGLKVNELHASTQVLPLQDLN